MGKQKLFWRTDYQIRAASLRVIDAEGKLLGLMSADEARAKAKEMGLTLVEIAPKAEPPVAKIVDFGKFRYAEEKKLKKQAKGAKGGELKEIRFSPFIGKADYDTRMIRVREFLEDKNKVKVVVVFLGKQMGSKPFGYQLVERIKKDLGENIAIDMAPKFLGRHLVTIISPMVKRKEKEVVTEIKEDAQPA